MCKKKPKIYTYDYPEQRGLCKGLIYGDIGYLSRITGYSGPSISRMMGGDRKMPDKVKYVIEKLLEKRAEFEASINNPEKEIETEGGADK